MKEVDKILENKYLVIHVMGPHAGESELMIFSRKKDEIKNAGKSLWLIKAKTEPIQSICKQASNENKEVYCIFIEASQKGGAKQTKTENEAAQFSEDNINWSEIPNGIKVTGKVDRNTTALVLKTLELTNNYPDIDLWNYSDFLDKSNPVKFNQWTSVVCSIKEFNKGMKSRNRKIIAFGKLEKPFAVWLK